MKNGREGERGDEERSRKRRGGDGEENPLTIEGEGGTTKGRSNVDNTTKLSFAHAWQYCTYDANIAFKKLVSKLIVD